MLSLLYQKKATLFTPFSLKQYFVDRRFSMHKQQMGDIRFLPHLVFESYVLFLKIQKKIQKNLRLEILPHSRMVIGQKYRQEILYCYTPLLYLAFVNKNVGKGLFTEDFIAKDDFVAEYTGIVRKKTKRVMNNNDYCLSYPIHPLKREFVVDAKEQGNFTRHINHSSHPNLDLLSVIIDGMMHMIFISLKDIEPGSQLTFDYGELYWKDQKGKPIVI